MRASRGRSAIGSLLWAGPQPYRAARCIGAVADRRRKFIATAALARSLAGVLWAMWRDDTAYDPARVGLRSATGLTRQAEDIEFRADAMKRAAERPPRRPSPRTQAKGDEPLTATTRTHSAS